jgi:uncharacterized Ntn-hydrolase superfamily protein
MEARRRNLLLPGDRTLDRLASRVMQRIVSTYSLVACDLDAREWGIAVQSKFLAVGAAVPYAAAEVGAVATQALANLSYGPRGLELLRGEGSAEDVVAALLAEDDGREHRQVGVVDRDGRGATYTGPSCLEWAGGRSGSGYAAQGNILVSRETVDALADTFEATAGRSLAERLLASIEAAQAAGGDRRGQQSAALLVVRKDGGYGGTSDRAVDLRVDDDHAPIAELQRLYRIHQRLFGATPRAQWVAVDDELRRELESRLRSKGYQQPNLVDAFNTWAGTENLEERIDGLGSIDPVVLGALRDEVG